MTGNVPTRSVFATVLSRVTARLCGRSSSALAWAFVIASAWALVVASGCASPSDTNQPPSDPPCSCTTGQRRCVGAAVQVCEQESATCSSWGEAVFCPSASCIEGVCQGDCQDSCSAGTGRCIDTGAREVCRVGRTGCLEWVRQDCAANQFCEQDQCVNAIPCDGVCPGGYTCQKNGICSGGNPAALTLNVKTVQVAGAVTMNGAAPLNGRYCSSTMNPSSRKAQLLFVEKQRGYTFTFDMTCRYTEYRFATTLYPGTYRVTVIGDSDPDITNLPPAGYIADDNFVVTGDVSGKVFDVKTVKVAGSVTLNGAAPVNGRYCSSTMNPSSTKTVVQFVEKAYGYTFEFPMTCRYTDYKFATTLYPGTYRVTVRGDSDPDITNVPEAAYVADGNFVVSADVTGKALDVKTVKVAGTVTLNGAAPMNGRYCSSTMNPSSTKTVVQFVEKTYGYTFEFLMSCRYTDYKFATTLYPGTYRVTVRGDSDPDITNVPQAAYVADGSFVVSADVTGKVLDLKTVKVAGSVTLNGAAPMNGRYCSSTMNPSSTKTVVQFVEKTYGYTFEFPMTCRYTDYKVATTLYPGTYRVTVRGDSDPDITNIPEAAYVADGNFIVTMDVSGKVLNLQTVQVKGDVLLNGAAPMNGRYCSNTMNPSSTKTTVRFVERTYRYTFDAQLLCRYNDYRFMLSVYPGIYEVVVIGDSDPDITNLPPAAYIAVDRLQIP